MPAMEVVAGRVVNPGAALTPLTADTGNTFAVRDFDPNTVTYLEEMWAQQATAGELRLHSPRMHDDVQGLRFQVSAGIIRSLFADEIRQQVYPNDTIRIEQSGGGAETDCAAYLLYYNSLAGIQQSLATWETVLPRIIDITGHVVQVTGPVTPGDWSAGNALNSFSQQLKADYTYALLGYECAVPELAVGIQGADTGNLRVGGPGPTEPIETRDWFISLARNTGSPYIPLIKANNAGSTLVSVARATAAGTDNLTLVMARLMP